MEVAKIQVGGTCACAYEKKTIRAGMVGVTVSFAFDEYWDGLNKIAVYRCGGVVRDEYLEGDTGTIPAEVLTKSGFDLEIGVYGTDAEKQIAIPTCWANLGVVRPGADPSGDPAADPELPFWAKVQEWLKTRFVKTVNGIGADENGNVAIPASKVEVDPTLTVEGSAADAKAVGEELGKKIAAPSTALIGQTVMVKAVDENGKPTEWEATDLPDGFGGSWNDLTDKPFGESVEEVEVIAETVANEAYNLWYKDSQSIKEGLTYAVYHNGERYECVAMLNKYGYPTLEAEPFKIADDSYGAYAFIVFTEKNVTHTISVFAISQTTALLPEKYIPNTIARTADIPTAVTDDHINSLIDAKLGVIENGTY